MDLMGFSLVSIKANVFWPFTGFSLGGSIIEALWNGGTPIKVDDFVILTTGQDTAAKILPRLRGGVGNAKKKIRATAKTLTGFDCNSIEYRV